ncbi:MAG: hypothetical protein K1W06_07355 [Lachnospiraceae bacterium]
MKESGNMKENKNIKEFYTCPNCGRAICGENILSRIKKVSGRRVNDGKIFYIPY